ncbi:unnamed protein product [Zymoseptoria tritici ST99CH_3D1]|nr:unnamed protein product [Zymoseptoria tritici ST99CH_3D1]
MRLLTLLMLAAALVAAAPTDHSPNVVAGAALGIARRNLTSVDSSEGSMAGQVDAASDDVASTEETSANNDYSATDDSSTTEETSTTEDLAAVDGSTDADSAGRHHPRPKLADPNDTCVKDEMGCDGQGGGAVLTMMFPIIGIIKGILHHHRDRLTLYRYDAGCVGDGGKQINDDPDHLEKGKCKDWEKAPDGPMSMNYILPKNKAFNHCNIYMYRQHDCYGEPFQVIHGRDDLYGNSTVQTLNGQNYCHDTTGMKSVRIGPCS